MRNNKEIILSKYFSEKMKPVDIANMLNISKSAVTQVLQKDERYQNEKLVRKHQNKIKHTEETKKYMKNKRAIISFNNSADKAIQDKLHDEASMLLSAPKKLSNMAYRNWNKSAYTYNIKRKGFEFRKELGRAHDVPKFIKLEV